MQAIQHHVRAGHGDRQILVGGYGHFVLIGATIAHIRHAEDILAWLIHNWIQRSFTAEHTAVVRFPEVNKVSALRRSVSVEGDGRILAVNFSIAARVGNRRRGIGGYDHRGDVGATGFGIGYREGIRTGGVNDRIGCIVAAENTAVDGSPLKYQIFTG